MSEIKRMIGDHVVMEDVFENETFFKDRFFIGI